ncbi:hypothetical protein SS50377_20535 [Spironucleus salmonicida]|uniref:Uncharacterized protein n=1 Tax=Spironucleus salmonicida TaxID=348837 RepID=A0A9P8LZ04_9EUKA|nr:hypothetical protein SS50377_20535 [Spironucleus salmonicida]
MGICPPKLKYVEQTDADDCFGQKTYQEFEFKLIRSQTQSTISLRTQAKQVFTSRSNLDIVLE